MSEPLIVMLHGWPGLPSDYDSVLGLLPGIRCIIPELSGLGAGFRGAPAPGTASAEAHAKRVLAGLPEDVSLIVVGYDIGSRRFSHIIDPATREPVESRLASVSVLAPTGREADGWATALMAAGGAGPALAGRRGISALFLFREGDGLRRTVTGHFAQHLV